MSDYVSRMHGATLGARLRRLSATIDADATRIYAELGIRFEQRWFGLINQLAIEGTMTVSALAEALGISHPSVSEARKSLESAGLIHATPDPQDSRKRVLSLSPAGEELVARLRPMWQAFDDAARELDQEAGEVSASLARLDQALARRSLYDRLKERFDPAEQAQSR
ncbi:MarR family transcriptional regulator [Novosphingobium sp. BL-8H]|uniref:MarR family winged helix-turn-helix transcriptional regulator n=1 Tax=Novosphingobium sp. BL-8H TaxID=3127640 RepID=UPI0037565842